MHIIFSFQLQYDFLLIEILVSIFFVSHVKNKYPSDFYHVEEKKGFETLLKKSRNFGIQLKGVTSMYRPTLLLTRIMNRQISFLSLLFAIFSIIIF